MRSFAKRSILDVWYAHLDIDNSAAAFIASLSDKQRKRSVAEVKSATELLDRARTRDNLQAIRKLTTETPAGRRIVSSPPLVIPVAELVEGDAGATTRSVEALLQSYRATLRSDRRLLLDHFDLTDVALKVVGVGSVGLRAWIVLLETGVESEGLLLQAKQAQRSVLADHAGESEYAEHGARVVAGQRLMQATSDIFLGWLHTDVVTGEREDYYVRQLRDWKVSAEIETMTPASMRTYARMCGWTLARAHARAGDRVALSGYLGKSVAFDEAVATFAVAYADQNERDHQALLAAVDAGDVPVRRGV
jgi:uncharacterized protein (DUF2252 family)